MIKNDFIYYNGSSLCQKLNPTDPDVPATFFDQRPAPIIEDATNWKCAIERFSVSSRCLPVWIPKMYNMSLSASQTAYELQLNLFSVTANGDTLQNICSSPVSLIYTCNTKYINSSATDPLSPYFYVFDINVFVDMMNNALQNAYNSLQTNLNQQSGFETVILQTKCPKMSFANNLFSIYFDGNGFGGIDALSNGTAQVENMALLMNADLQNLLCNLNVSYFQNNPTSIPALLPYEVNVSNRISNLLSIGSKTYYIESQSYESTSCVFSPVQSIVFVGNLGLQTEYTGTTNILNSQNNNYLSSTGIENNITDISLALDTCQDYNSLISFVPAHLRYCDILINEIRNIDIKIYWKHISGLNYPLLLTDNAYMNIKIGFYRK